MLKLVTAKVCPFAHRARLAASAKGVDAERVEIDLKDMPAWFLAQSPNRKVPLLIHDDQKIWESLVVIQYIDEAFDGPSLMPGTPYDRALARIGIETAGSEFIPLFMKLLKGEVEKPQEKLQEVWEKLEKTMSHHGVFWVGETISLADIAIYPWFERFSALQHYQGLELELPPLLKSWLAAMQKHPAVQKEAGSPSLYIEAFAKFAPASVK